MKDLLKKFEEKNSEIVFHWNDPESEAEGWAVINSLRGGAAGGGTRMRKGLDYNEVLSLAKTMEIKFTVSGPPIGGAKSGINFDPADPRKKDVLQRWFQAVSPLLKGYYGTGGDMNVSEVNEVIPFSEAAGLWHPQEGIFNGHFVPTEAQKIRRIGQLRKGVSRIVKNKDYTPDVNQEYKVADLITGFGISQAVKHFYDIFGGRIREKRAIIQGFGNVGSAAAYFLSKMGVKIVGIMDIHGGVICEEGFSFEEIKEFYLNKEGGLLNAKNLIPFDELNQKIWQVKTDVFIPCAASRLVSGNQVEQLIDAGLELISCGANVPFADSEIFLGPIMQYADAKISVIPDFISNCGMARVFAFLMKQKVELTDEVIFEDVSTTIKNSILEIYNQNSTKINLSASALEIALKKLL